MSLLQVFLASLGSFALLQFAFIPWSKHRLQIDRSLTSIGRSAMLATLGYARGALLTVTATTAVLLLIVTVLRFQGGTTIEQLEAAISTLQLWRGRFASFGPVWGGIALVLLMVAMGAHAHRSGKRRMEKVFQKIRFREWERLRAERAQGLLEELPPTLAMTSAEQEIVRLNARRNDLLGFLGSSQERVEQINAISQRVAMLENYMADLDIGRRVRLQLEPEQAVLPAPRSGWEKLQSLLYSRGLLLSLGAGSRLLHAAGAGPARAVLAGRLLTGRESGAGESRVPSFPAAGRAEQNSGLQKRPAGQGIVRSCPGAARGSNAAER